MAVFRRQRPTRFDKCTNVLLSFWRWNTGSLFHSVNCRGCGQISWPCHENKNRKFFFLTCLVVIRMLAKISRCTVIVAMWPVKWVVSTVVQCLDSGESDKEGTVRGDQNKELVTQGHHYLHLPHFYAAHCAGPKVCVWINSREGGSSEKLIYRRKFYFLMLREFY